MEITLLLIGAILGGVTSWIISHIYYRKARQDVENTGPPDKIWGKYTNCPKCNATSHTFHYLAFWDDRGEGIMDVVKCRKCGWLSKGLYR